LKYYFFNSLSQGFAQVSVLLSGYISYFILYSSGQAHLLSTVTLLVTIQAIVNLKAPMYQLSLLIPSYYTLLSVLERFAQILNIKHIQMEQLESEHDDDKFSRKLDPSNAIEL
jgi:ABC-type multidrug transport system fused ATPase/permease subunit